VCVAGQFGGLALSTSLVAICNVFILITILRKKVGSLGGKRIIKSYSKIFLASAVMGTVVYFLWSWISCFAYQSLPALIFSLLTVIILGAGIYILCTVWFRMEEIKFVADLLKNLRKKFM